MQQRNRDPGHHLSGQLVHGIGGQQQNIGSASLKRVGLTVQNGCRSTPVINRLHRRDGGEIQRADQQLRRMKPAKPLAGQVA